MYLKIAISKERSTVFFASHRIQKHTLHSLNDFKAKLFHRYRIHVNARDEPADEEDIACSKGYDEGKNCLT